MSVDQVEEILTGLYSQGQVQIGNDSSVLLNPPLFKLYKIALPDLALSTKGQGIDTQRRQ